MKQKTQMNEIVSVDETNFSIEKNKLDINLQVFLELENSFENITGSKTFLTIEALQKLIIDKSGFPNVEASVKLMDYELSYNYILKYVDDVVLELIDTEAKIVPKDVLEALKEQFTTRLSDDAQTNYPKLIQIAKLYDEITNKDYIHSIITTDYRATWNVDIQSLNQIDMMAKLRF